MDSLSLLVLLSSTRTRSLLQLAAALHQQVDVQEWKPQSVQKDYEGVAAHGVGVLHEKEDWIAAFVLRELVVSDVDVTEFTSHAHWVEDDEEGVTHPQ